MSLVNRQVDPLIIPIVTIIIFVAFVTLFLIPAMEAKSIAFNEQKEIILNSTCDELKQIIVNHYEDKTELIGQNILTAKNLHEWKCEK